MRSRSTRIALVGLLLLAAGAAALGGMGGLGGSSSTPATKKAAAPDCETKGKKAYPAKPLQGSAVVHASWFTRPDNLKQMKKLSDLVVLGKVTKVEDGEPLAPTGGPDAEPLPTQLVTLDVCKSMRGKKPDTVTVFRTGSDGLSLEEDPLYAVGEVYLLFLESRGDGSYIPVSPNGRIFVDGSGKLARLAHHGTADEGLVGQDVGPGAQHIADIGDTTTVDLALARTSDGKLEDNLHWQARPWRYPRDHSYFSPAYPHSMWIHTHYRNRTYWIDGGTAETRGEASDSAMMWSDKTVMNLTRTYNEDAADLKVLIKDYGKNGWWGLATGYIHCGQCNTPYGMRTLARRNAWYGGTFGQRRAVMCQEIGHTFGLGHAAGDCMGAGYFVNDTNWVGNHSANALNCLMSAHDGRFWGHGTQYDPSCDLG